MDLQLKRGTTVKHSTFTGKVGEVTVDTDKDTVVVHDGTTAGGFPMARESVVTALAGNVYTKSEVNTALDAKVDDTEIASVNLLRADRYLASQTVANMVYTNGDLTKIQYKNATDVDYEVLAYSNGDLSTVQHYVGGVLKGTTTLSYASGNLVSAIFVGV